MTRRGTIVRAFPLIFIESKYKLEKDIPPGNHHPTDTILRLSNNIKIIFTDIFYFKPCLLEKNSFLENISSFVITSGKWKYSLAE